MLKQWLYERKLRKLQAKKREIVAKIENRDSILTADQERELLHAEWDISLLITEFIEEEAERYRVPIPSGSGGSDNEYWRKDTRSGKMMLTREGVQFLDANIHAAVTRLWERKSRKIEMISMFLSLLIALGGLLVAILSLSIKVVEQK